MTLDILSFFPFKTIEPEQRALLRAYARLPRNVQVVVLNVAVAGGKTALLETIGRWEDAVGGGGATYLAPDNNLLGQVVGDTGWAPAPYKARSGDWVREKLAWLNEPLKVANYYSHLALRSYSRTILVDEAHNIKDMLQSMEGGKLWHHLTPWPLDTRTVEQFLYWLHTDPAASEYKALARLIAKDPTNYTMKQERALYRGKEQLCMHIIPLTPKAARPVLWPPSKVGRIVLASATLSREDLTDMGLGQKYTAWLSAPSRIPVENRPLVYMPVAYPVYGRDKEIEKLAKTIKELSSYHKGERGIVHVTYNIMDKLRPYLAADKTFFFHTRSPVHKKRVFEAWLSTPGSVLIGAGFYEGINLKYDKASWQAIGKIMWPSLADEATRIKSEVRPEWYLWEAMKYVMQAYGRICRMPDDYGITYILTGEFFRLYSECVKANLLPEWFIEAWEQRVWPWK